VESIFYHHPTAQVNVYSNTLLDDTFQVLTDAGYSIQIQKYNLISMLNGSPAQRFVKELKNARKGPYWYANEANLLRLLLLYKYGGIYMDTDMIVVRPLDTLGNNIVGWQGANTLNNAFLKFEKNNIFLRASLENFVKHYSGRYWGHNGPDLLTRVYRASHWGQDIVKPVDHKLFYMIHYSKMKRQCFEDTEGETFRANMKTLRTEAFVFHTNSKITWSKGANGNLKDGTICKHILNSYCVLCDTIY
jgi:lactosylceramide 4-alpha-galactosyltransferase